VPPASYWTLEFSDDRGKFLGGAFVYAVSDEHAIQGLALVGALPHGHYDCVAVTTESPIAPPVEAMFRLITDRVEFDMIDRIWTAARVAAFTAGRS